MSTKVKLVRCENYRDADSAVAEAVGDIKEYIKKDEKVLIKVNLLQLRTAEEAVTTNPAVVDAVIKLVKKQTDKITVGDSPAMGSVERIAKKAGILEVCKKHKVRLSDLGKGVRVKNDKGNIKSFIICEEVLKYDKIVNIPKLKTHSLTIMTNATKNLFGFIPGMDKPKCHLRITNPYKFTEMLIDLGILIKPCLNICDAVEAMEGQGPSSGTVKKVNLIMASNDHIAMDVIAAQITGLKVPLVDIAKRRKLVSDIEVIGDLDEFRTKFEAPSKSNKLAYYGSVLAKNIFIPKPILITKRCIKCRACFNICPAGAIKMDPYPEFDYKKCIRCYCCHEYCPKAAIKVRRWWRR